MTVLRNSLYAAAALAALVPALAQDKPWPEDTQEFITSITLPDPQKPEGAQPQAAGEPKTDQAQPVTPPPVDDKVDVGTLGSAEGDPAGLLDGTNGLGDDLWNGSARGDIERLLERVSPVSADPPMRELVRRIVLTRARMPYGQAKRAAIAVRIEKLLEAGLIDEAGALAAQANVANDADFARVQANALLYAGRADDACSDRTATRQTSGEPFWIELRATCAAAAGDTALAELTRAVLDAQGGDAAFGTLLDDVLNRQSVAPAAIHRPSALHVFLLRKLDLPVGGALAAAGGTPENLFALRDARNPLPIRLAAAERIAGTGAASIAELRAAMDAQTAPADKLANAEKEARDLPFLASQSLLRRAAQVETKPDRKANLIRQALEAGIQAKMFPLAASLQSDVLSKIPPAKIDAAPLFVRALILSGNPKTAARWQTGDVFLSLLTAPAGDSGSEAAMSALVDELLTNPDATDRDAKALLVGMADVLGRLPHDAQQKALNLAGIRWYGKRPDEGAMQKIEDAAGAKGRKGEALLLILEQIRAIGWRDMAPDAGVRLVRLLVALGQRDAAEGFAREALVSYAPPPSAP
jgi:hypothetical protein